MTISGYAGTELKFGAEVRIVKLKPDGTVTATYAGTLVASPPGWVVARATWTHRRIDIGCLVFEPHDYLLEYFPTEAPFNAFALFSCAGEFKGWYCNVTHPTTIRDRTIFWHDLYVDIIQQADGTIHILDEDELADSGVLEDDPELHELITNARDSVVEKMRSNQYPFSEVALQRR
jgi:protein associated with RNAse G/E